MRAAALAIFFTLLGLGCLAAADADAGRQAFTEATASYNAQNYAEAAKQFDALNRGYEPHPTFAYNAGNAAFAAGDLPGATLHYQRALEMDPNFSAAQQNLAIVRAQAQLPVPDPQTAERFRRVGVDAPVIAAVVLAWLGIGSCALLTARLLRRQPGKGFPAVVGLVFLGTALYLGLDARQRWERFQSETVGVVFSPVSAYSEFAGAGAKVEDLKPATSVLVQTVRGNYAYALLPSGKQAWIQLDALKMVPHR